MIDAKTYTFKTSGLMTHTSPNYSLNSSPIPILYDISHGFVNTKHD